MITGMREGLVTGPIVSGKSGARVTLTQGPSRLYKVVTWLFTLLFLVGIPMLAKSFSSGSTTSLYCDRSTDKCEMSGDSHRKLEVSKIATAQILHWWQHKKGDSLCVELTMTDGTKVDISPFCSMEEESAKTYVSAVDRISKFLADKNEQKLDVAWNYRQTWAERIYGIIMAGVCLLWTVMLVRLWKTRTLTFDKSSNRLTLSTKPLWRPAIVDPQEVPLDEMVAVEAVPGSIVQVTRKDGTKTNFLTPRTSERAADLAADLRTVIAPA
ncbi:hypothetical protein BH11MYX2_BH11MYX2_13880 [soil metagenome]